MSRAEKLTERASLPRRTVPGVSDERYELRLQDAKRRLVEHPGYADFYTRRALYGTIAHVFRPNFYELMRLLDAPSKNEQLAAELVQNVRRPDVREVYEAALMRALHNHVASSRTLVDHVRRVMKGQTGYVADEFDARRAKLLEHGEVHFIHGLRNFMLHRTLPFVSHELSISDVNQPTQAFKAKVSLSAAQLLEDDSWSAPARTYVRDQPDDVDLRHAVLLHGDLVYRLNSWLYDALEDEAGAVVEELNRLVDEVNAALLDCDVETARAHPIHEMRQQP